MFRLYLNFHLIQFKFTERDVQHVRRKREECSACSTVAKSVNNVRRVQILYEALIFVCGLSFFIGFCKNIFPHCPRYPREISTDMGVIDHVEYEYAGFSRRTHSLKPVRNDTVQLFNLKIIIDSFLIIIEPDF